MRMWMRMWIQILGSAVPQSRRLLTSLSEPVLTSGGDNVLVRR